MAEVVAQLEKQLDSERKELAYARLKIQVLEEQLRQQRYVQDADVHAPSVISLNAVAAAHAVDDYLLSATGLLPATYEPRWRRFHPASSAVKGRVRYDIPRSDPDCIECSGGGRLAHGHQQRLPTKG